jgi:hypothetical protein
VPAPLLIKDSDDGKSDSNDVNKNTALVLKTATSAEQV